MVKVSNPKPIKDMFSIPFNMRSCHTAKIGDYFVEGHIPASDIKKLLSRKLDIKGLIVPGMPGGSPGMESSPYQPYKVFSMDKNGNIGVFSQH